MSGDACYFICSIFGRRMVDEIIKLKEIPFKFENIALVKMAK